MSTQPDEKPTAADPKGELGNVLSSQSMSEPPSAAGDPLSSSAPPSDGLQPIVMPSRGPGAAPASDPLVPHSSGMNAGPLLQPEMQPGADLRIVAEEPFSQSPLLTSRADVTTAPVLLDPANVERESCLNCGHPAPSLFCPQCGMRMTEPKPSLGELSRFVVQEFFHFDRKLGRTLFLLLLGPGLLAREYLAGRKLASVSPLKLFVAIHALHAVCSALLPQLVVMGDGLPDVNVLTWDVQYARADALIDPDAATEGWVERTFKDTFMPRIAWLDLPLTALILGLFFRSSRRRYVEHLVVATHAHVAAMLVSFTLFLPWGALWRPVLLVVASAGPVFLLLHVKGYYQRGWLWSVLAAAVTSMASAGALVALGFLSHELVSWLDGLASA